MFFVRPPWPSFWYVVLGIQETLSYWLQSVDYGAIMMQIVHYQISGKSFQCSQSWVNDPCIGWRYHKNHPVGRWLQGKLLRSLGMMKFFFGWKSTPLCDFIFGYFVWGPKIAPLITGLWAHLVGMISNSEWSNPAVFGRSQNRAMPGWPEIFCSGRRQQPRIL